MNKIEDFHKVLEPDYMSVQDIRDKLANTMLICIAVIGLPLILISYLSYLKTGSLLLFTPNLIVYLLCLISSCYHKKIPVRMKSILLIVCSFLVAVTSLLKWGITGSGTTYFVFGSILATIFFGVKPGIFLTVLNIIIMVITGLLYHTGLWQFSFNINENSITLSAWFNALAVYGSFTTVLIVSIGWVFKSMAGSIEKLVNSTVELNESKEHLEKEIENRKQVENSLKESEKRFQLILENLPVGVFVHDLEGNYLINTINLQLC